MCPSFLNSATISRPKAESIASFDRLKKRVGLSRYCSASLNRSPSRTRSRSIAAPPKSEPMPTQDSEKWPLSASLIFSGWGPIPKSSSCLSGFPGVVEGRVCRCSCSERCARGVREAEVACRSSVFTDDLLRRGSPRRLGAIAEPLLVITCARGSAVTCLIWELQFWKTLLRLEEASS